MTEIKLAPGLALPLDLVTEASAIVATRGAGKSSTSAVVVEEIFKAGVQSVIFDRTGVYWGLRSNAKGDGPGLPIYVLGGPHGDVPLEPHAGALIADLVVDSGHSFVLDLSDFSKSAALKFAADFLERIYDRKARARTTTLLVMDEAHFYAPQTPRGGFKGDAARLMGAMEDVVGLGRSRGLGIVLTTQRTQSLNKAVLDLIETLIVMRMLSPRAQAAVKDWIQEKQEDEHGVLATLNALADGEAWIWSPLRGILRRVQIRRIKTFNSYAAPKAGSSEKVLEPSARKELDLAALGEQMQATAERAKENDPAELRKRVRDLSAQVAELERRPVESAPPPLPERVEVEVPVLSDEQLEELRNFRVQIETQIGELTTTAGVLTTIAGEISGAVATWTNRPERQEIRQEIGPIEPLSETLQKFKTFEPPALEAPRRSGSSNGDGPTGPQQRILDALSWWETVGVTQPSRGQLAFVAGYHERTKSFTNALSSLSSSGKVIYPSPGYVSLTSEGRPYAQPPQMVPTEQDLQRLIFSQLKQHLQRILAPLIAAAPDPLSREELAVRLGYHERTKSFTNGVSRLSSLGLVVYPRPGLVAASPLNFLERR